jgi:membrane associated rhomboid family serine protease
MAHVAVFLVCGVCISVLGLQTMVSALELYTPSVWHGQVWRLASYVFFDPMFFMRTSLWFPFNMLVLFFCGREVEQLVGRKAYLAVYISLVLVPSILLCLFGLITGQPFEYITGNAVFGVFVAFATIYPGAMPWMWVPIPMWVMASLLIALFTFLDFVGHAWVEMYMLWCCSSIGYLGMRFVGAGRGFDRLTDWVETRRAEKLARRHNIQVLTEKKSNESIDAILDKISKQGMNSLSSSERAALDRARAKLLDRDRR